MKKYLYLSLTPEALIASMLPPYEFGNYLAVGTKKRTRGEAIFLEVDMEKLNNHFPLDLIEKRCVPKADGTPKRSVYLSISKASGQIPSNGFLVFNLFTMTERVLKLRKGE